MSSSTFDPTTSRNTRYVNKQFLVTWTKETSTPIAVEFGIPGFKQQSTDQVLNSTDDLICITYHPELAQLYFDDSVNIGFITKG